MYVMLPKKGVLLLPKLDGNCAPVDKEIVEHLNNERPVAMCGICTLMDVTHPKKQGAETSLKNQQPFHGKLSSAHCWRTWRECWMTLRPPGNFE